MKVLGVSEATANVILLGLTLVAIAMSFVWGWLCDRLGPEADAGDRPGLMGGRAGHRWRSRCGFGPAGLGLFLVAGAILGSGLGGVQVADRVLMVRLSPPDRLGEFFGLYGLVGKGSQVIGQLLYGATIFLLLGPLGVGAYQVAVLSLLVTMFIGLWLIWPVRDDWAGSGEVATPAVRRRSACAPATAPLEPRLGRARSVRRSRRVRLPPRPGRPDHLLEAGPRGRQPSTSAARSVARRGPADRRPGGARSCAGSAGRRRSAAARTSRTLKPPPLPRLQTSGSSVRASPGAVASSASRCASARSATWM